MNIFKDFFERHRRHSERFGPQDIPRDILNDLYDRHGENSDQTTETDDAPNFAFGSSMDFLSEVEEMFDHFFKGFGRFEIMPFPSLKGNEIMSPEGQEERSSGRPKSLQERMLNDNKEPDESQEPKIPFTFDDLEKPKGNFPFGSDTITREDRDLDEDLRKGDRSLDDILPRRDNQPTIQRPSSLSYFSSSVTRNRDGVIETKKTVKDSSGNEEVTITRKVDGKEYTISHKKDEFGNEETRENGRDVNHPSLLAPQEQPVPDRPLRDWFKGMFDSWK